MKNVCCEYDGLNGRHSFLQATGVHKVHLVLMVLCANRNALMYTTNNSGGGQATAGEQENSTYR